MENLKNLFEEIKPVDQEMIIKAKEHIANLTMPHWALGDLLDMGVKLSGVQRNFPPKIGKKSVYIFACDHGITTEGVSLFPKEVTAQMVANFVAGGAAINVLSRHADAQTIIVDMGVDADFSSFIENGSILDRKISRGTKNFYLENAMNKKEAYDSLQVGFDLVKESYDRTSLYATGEMGIGNTTTSAALTASLLNKDVHEVTGLGTGIDLKAREHKIEIIKEALLRREITPKLEAMEIFERIGSFEIGAMAGMCLGCAYFGRPVIIDGFISSTAALLAARINPKVIQYMFLAHKSVEPGHQNIYDELNLTPMLDLNMRLGEGSGTPLAMNLLEASCKILSEMASFETASVSRKD